MGPNPQDSSSSGYPALKVQPALVYSLELSKSENREHTCLFGWCGFHEQSRFVAKINRFIFLCRGEENYETHTHVIRFGADALAPIAFAQKPMDQASEKAVQITQGPTISNITGNSATINWTTNSAGANHVRYRVAGSNSAWKSAYAAGGGTNHSCN